jgi:hypothetical protein
MPTLLEPTSGNPVDCGNYTDILSDLIKVIDSKSPAVIDFKDLMEPRQSRSAAVKLLQKSQKNNPLDFNALSLFRNLEDMANSCQNDQVWWHKLGEITEGVFIKLLERKYSHIPIQEHTAKLFDTSGLEIDSLNGKSMDAVVWNLQEDRGEMHEAKKTIMTNIRSNDVGFGEKLSILARFKKSANRLSSKKSFIGVSTFYETSTLVRNLIKVKYSLGQNDLDVLGRDGIHNWLSTPYLSKVG